MADDEDQTVKLPNGDLYVGRIGNGKPQGAGQLQSRVAAARASMLRGSRKLDGAGPFYTAGVYTWADGSRYEGEWEDGVKHGKKCVGFAMRTYVEASAGQCRRSMPQQAWRLLSRANGVCVLSLPRALQAREDT